MVGPERGLRMGKDPLWLDMAAVHTRPANRPDIPADAVDAIPMFKDKPASDEEQEQCSRQLTAQVCTSLWLERKENERKDYNFWRQCNEKPSIILGCPGLYGYMPITMTAAGCVIAGCVQHAML